MQVRQIDHPVSVHMLVSTDYMAGVKNGVTIIDQYYLGAALQPLALIFSQYRNHLLSIRRSNPIVVDNTLLPHPTFLPQFYFHVLCRTDKCFRRVKWICATQKYLHRYIVSGLEFEIVQIQFNNSQRLLCIASVIWFTARKKISTVPTSTTTIHSLPRGNTSFPNVGESVRT